MTSSSRSPTDSHSPAEDSPALIMASPGCMRLTIAPPGGLCPDAHHHLDDVLQALLVHLVRLIHVFDVEAQAMGHHAARIHLPALLERDHIFNVGGRVATAGARGWDNGGLFVQPETVVHRDDVATL